MSEKFCLKWNDFHSNVSNSFGLFRNEDYLHDVTLVSDDHKQVSAHKLVLSASSEYFKDIFKQNSKPNVHPLLCLDGISADDLQNIMDYIYNGEVNIFQENLDRFLSIAQRLKLEGLIGNNEEGSQQAVYKDAKEAKNAKEEYEPNEVYYEPKISYYEQQKFRQGASSEDKVIVPVANVDMNEIDNTVNQHLEKIAAGEFKCKLCGKEAKRSIDMKRHIETHLEGLSYPCQECGKTFRSRNSLKCHRYQSHK